MNSYLDYAPQAQKEKEKGGGAGLELKARGRASSHFCFLFIVFVAFHPSVVSYPDTLFFSPFSIMLGMIKHITKDKM